MANDQQGLVHFIPESRRVEVEEQVELFHTTLTNAVNTLHLEMVGYEAFLKDLLYGDDYRFPRRKF